MKIKDNESALAQDMASALFGMDGVEVTDTEHGDGARLTVWTKATLPAVCPECSTAQGRTLRNMPLHIPVQGN